MNPDALAPYERALRTRAPLALVGGDGEPVVLDVSRWLAAVDAVDLAVVERCTGPVLDVGCGPGRFVGALAGRGVAALGLDIAPVAVSLARAAGAPALHRSVFDAVPGEGRWATVLLMDGNIGIGGDPVRLLSRIADLLRPAGRLVVETDPREHVRHAGWVRFHDGAAAVGPEFPWAVVGAAALRADAGPAGYAVSEEWSCDGRVFVTLERRSRTTRAA